MTQQRITDMQLFIGCYLNLRDMQKRYFKSRTLGDLERAREAERDLDGRVKRWLEGHNPQSSFQFKE